jgi:hypothetical protein
MEQFAGPFQRGHPKQALFRIVEHHYLWQFVMAKSLWTYATDRCKNVISLARSFFCLTISWGQSGGVGCRRLAVLDTAWECTLTKEMCSTEHSQN